MRIGVHLRHWEGSPHDVATLSKLAEDAGLESVWVSETWGSDATVLAAWIAAHTSTIAIGTGVLQIPARTPAAAAMAALTLDHLSGGRLRLRARRERAAGRGGLARGSVRLAARAHTRVRDARARGAGTARTPRAGRRGLHAAGPRRTGQAVEDERDAAACRRADLPRGDGSQERGARDRDRGRMAAAVVLPGARGRVRVAGTARRVRSGPDGADRDRRRSCRGARRGPAPDRAVRWRVRLSRRRTSTRTSFGATGSRRRSIGSKRRPWTGGWPTPRPRSATSSSTP